ncbi:MAG: alpha-L-fucosidase [Ferruginibacter sp.]|nr:alpha-L-fucosidase [Ferruginibacter sp.]
MKVHQLISSFIFCMGFQYAFSQKIGGGELNPGIYSNPQSIKKFQDMRFGLSIHWGPNSVAGKEISWSRGKETPVAEYDNFYRQFNPTKFNADEWVKMMEDFGMKYTIITSKHHDGFSMWHSEYSAYDVAATPFRRDILKELSDACGKKGIVFGTYYSSLDWYHPDYQPYGHGGPGLLFSKDGDTPNQNRYWIYAKNQIRELITKYHAQIIQFDGDWDKTWTHEIGSDMYLYIRKLNDMVLVNSRTDKGRNPPPPYSAKEPWRADIFAGDFEERERFTNNFPDEKIKIISKSPNPWQAWVTVDKSQWSWKPDPALLTPKEIIIDLLKTIGDGGNYLINIGPRPDGTFEPVIVANMKVVGNWVKAHGDAIYGTLGGDFSEEGKFTSSQKGTTTNLFVFDDAIEHLTLNCGNRKLLSLKNEKGQAVNFKQLDSNVMVKLDKNIGDFLRVYTLTF